MSDTRSEDQALPAVMNQLPESNLDVRVESPLHHVELAAAAADCEQKAGLCFREVGLQGHLTLRGNPSNVDLLAAVQDALGMALPLTPLTSVVQGEWVIRWISPDEWLITLLNEQAFHLESRFRDQVRGHYALVNASGGLTVFQLSGECAIDVLKKSVPVDLHESVFPVGKVVSTVFAKASAVVRRTDQNQFELVVRRSFADYLWIWIQSASQEFGLSIEV
jgi:sarcosine oxidase subunit gamma